jgi:uncharacterized membrane protein
MKDTLDLTTSSVTRRENDARPLMPFGGVFITAFVIAMQESRERQAAREIRRYGHLAHEADAYEARRLAELKRDLLQNRSDDVNDGPRTARGRSGLALAGRILIATALIAFGVLHFIGDAIIRSASSPAAAGQHTLAAD